MCRANDGNLDDHSLVDAQPWCDPGESEQGSEEATQLQGRRKH